MSSIPLAMFQADRVHELVREKFRESQNNTSKDDDRGRKLPKDGHMYKYNLKFMNSVWGMYNRYAPEAFQKNYEKISALY